ncbi:lysostaphin resistance A-like protein [Colwelliaceae bacterium 6441]
MTSITASTLKDDKQRHKVTQNKQATIKKGWVRAIVGVIVISLFSGLGVVPLILTGTLTLEMTQMSASGLFNAVGVNTFCAIMFFQLIAVLLFIYVFRIYVDKESLKSLGFEFANVQSDLFKGLVWGALLISVGFLLLYFTGFLAIVGIDIAAIEWLSYLAFFMIVALNEEILVRGYVLTNLMASMNKYWALLVSALIFSFMHLGNDNTSLISTVNLFLAGIMLGIYTIHKGNLWFPIGMHFTWNFVQGPILGFEVSGTKMESVIHQEVMGNPFITGGEFGFEGSLLLTVMMVLSTVYLHNKYKKNVNSTEG